MKNKFLFSCTVWAALLFASGLSLARDLSSLSWDLSRYARKDGSIITVDVPKGHEREGGSARVELDLSEFSGKCFTAEIAAQGERITEPPDRWNGLKFMFHYTDAKTGEGRWPNTASRLGDFPRQIIFVSDNELDRPLGKVQLTLGLQDSSGKVVFDLSTFKIYTTPDLFPRVNKSYKVAYPPQVANLPPQRGVMLPGGDCKEDDFRTLHAWGATLARYQMIRNWHKQNDNQDLADYDAWLNGKLDHLEHVVLPLARKYGIRLVIDLHVAPGGRRGSEMNMFFDAKWADHFIACWQRIATRFKGRPEIYGFDLINEPNQERRSPTGLDYWNVQRRAAEAVRAIDPVTPIIIESNGWDSPAAFSYLSPLAMDNVIYQVHMYLPFAFTHQGVHTGADGSYTKTKYPDSAKGWNRDYLKKQLAPVLAFQKKHNARIYVGEFSAIAWAEGAGNFLADCISVFEEYGWDWTYHAFREWQGWSVEHAGENARSLVPSTDNPRRRALLNGLARSRSDQKTTLLFYAPFDGSPNATLAQGMKTPSRAKGLSFVEGHRGQALHLAPGRDHALAYSAFENLVGKQGSLLCWMRAKWADRPPTEWRHVALTWDEKGAKVYFDGHPETATDALGGKPLQLTDILAFPPDPEFFYVGGANGERRDDIYLDDLRIYSAPMSAAEIRQLARRESVAEIVLQKAALYADQTTTLDVRTTSPAKLDLSELKYCIHTRDGKPVVQFRQTVSHDTVKLPVNLPAGLYVLRVTDGDWFYGCAPFMVRPAGEAPAPVVQETKPARGLQRFWHDVKAFDFENMRRR